MAPKRMRFSFSSCPPLLLLLPVLVPTVLSYDSDFGFYSKDSQPCLDSASKSSQCTGGDAQELNQCLCSNGGNFIINAALCLGDKDPLDLSRVYQIMADACSVSKTPISVSEKAFLDAGTEGDFTTHPSTKTSATSSTRTSTRTITRTATGTSPATSTATATLTLMSAVSSTLTGKSGTASPTQSNPSSGADVDTKSSGLAKGPMIGLAVGASVVGTALISALFLFLRHRQKKVEDETSPMMAQNDYYKRDTATTFPPTEPSPPLPLAGSDAKASWGSSPSPAYPSSTDFNKSPGQYAGPYAAPTPQDSTAMHGAPSPAAFEMDASATPTPALVEAPVEMEGCAPPTHHQSRQ
ncbi:uncharacterized protein MAM_06299 [Metarhizium album ARSEF 1941]|uniref:Uncharacterized protein n=1 Tax=Metarhizium album (strain ARSEF 1941) TaxID=1081103 RepID=A0A0B2WR16_METAS|nr:uncharacterized protein MAM_06299 [Metarhizium album ARSEF 1941]KHN95937.1 hypothetical protein MAM_06299 [Metarhizium album ARSEF 1941]